MVIERLSILMVWLFLCLIYPNITSAQRLHDKARDEKAQQAVKLAAEIESNSIFEKQLKNLTIVANQDIETYFADVQRTIRSDISSFETWEDADLVVSRVRSSIESSNRNKPTADKTQEQRAHFKNEVEAAQAALRDLQNRSVVDKFDDQTRDAVKVLQGKSNKFDESGQKAIATLQQKASVGDFDKDTRSSVKQLQQSAKTAKLDGVTRNAIDILQKKSDLTSDGTLAKLFTGIEKSKPLQEFLNDKFLDEASADVLTELTEIAERLGKTYKAYTDRIDEIRKLEATLNELKVPLQKVALESLKVEAEHWKLLGAIVARRQETEKNIISIANDYEKIMNELLLGLPAGKGILNINLSNAQKAQREAIAKNKIRDTLQNDIDYTSCNKEYRINGFFIALYDATALSAHGKTPGYLERIRRAQEERRYSIRKSAIMTRSREVLVSTGVQRLALFYKGGITPELLAQLIYTAATVAIPPTISTR